MSYLAQKIIWAWEPSTQVFTSVPGAPFIMDYTTLLQKVFTVAEPHGIQKEMCVPFEALEVQGTWLFLGE